MYLIRLPSELTVGATIILCTRRNSVRIIAMSDSHGNAYALKKIFERTKDTGDIFVHLGDGQRELDLMRAEYPSLEIHHVAGNCDYGSVSPNFEVIPCRDTKILITHGHIYGINYGRETLRCTAQNFGCKAALFGHTHCRYEGYEDGVYLMNPGSCSCPRDFNKPSYGFVDITPNGIITNIVDLD